MLSEYRKKNFSYNYFGFWMMCDMCEWMHIWVYMCMRAIRYRDSKTQKGYI